VKFQMSGFADLVRHNIVVHIGDDLEVPQIRMQVASLSQTVTVTSESEAIVPTTSGESAATKLGHRTIQFEGKFFF
jgi:hypothetical protein